MKVLYVYRNIKMGFSIDNVFRPIEAEMKKHCDVDSIMFENDRYTVKALVNNIKRIRAYLKKEPDTIVHITGTEHYLLPFLRKYKTVVTVHDLGFYTAHKKTLKLYLKKFPLWIASLVYAKKITFISEKSSREAEKLVDISHNDVYVIYNPVNNAFVPNLAENFTSDKPTFLQIGTGENKNLERVVEALEDIPCNLRIIGRLSEKQKLFLKHHNIAYSQVEDIPFEQIVKEYQMADAVIFASLHEGFGMPIIEGQASGKSVLTSAISPMKEIANGSCPLCNPFDVSSIKTGVYELIKNHVTYERLGLSNAQRFTPSIIAREYLKVYESFEA